MNTEVRSPTGVVITLVFVMSTAVAQSADTGVNVPCPTWSVGDSWETKSSDPYAIETVSSIVKSRDGNKILIAEKRVHQRTRVDPRAPKGSKPPVVTTESEIWYEVVGQNIVMRQQKVGPMQVAFDPPQAFCGQVPATATFRAKSVVMGNTALSEGTVTARARGKQKVEVPAGTFDATVVEYQSTATSDPSPAGGGPGHRSVVTQFVVDKIGIVKTILSTSTPTVESGSAVDPRAEAALKEGLEKMRKGEAIEDTMATIQSMGGPGETRLVFVDVEKVTELVSYRPSK